MDNRIEDKDLIQTLTSAFEDFDGCSPDAVCKPNDKNEVDCRDCLEKWLQNILNSYYKPKIERAKREERERIREWGNELCPHGTVMLRGALTFHDKVKRECNTCWQALKGGE